MLVASDKKLVIAKKNSAAVYFQPRRPLAARTRNAAAVGQNISNCTSRLVYYDIIAEVIKHPVHSKVCMVRRLNAIVGYDHSL
mmetsp:Transcript_71439/g.141697  ORF Transcript_71439/g.141697 Transcript_71439/m.141697 type:complete len:83 (+) Transcript_71439:495-743(+)